MEALAERGVALVEVGSDDLAEVAAERGVTYRATAVPIDDEPTAGALDAALAGLESRALATGSALGAAQPYPISIERLAAWAATLQDEGLVLAPVTALFSVSSSGSGLEDEGPDVAVAPDG